MNGNHCSNCWKVVSTIYRPNPNDAGGVKEFGLTQTIMGMLANALIAIGIETVIEVLGNEQRLKIAICSVKR